MFKTYSTVTKKYYDTLEEAQAAESAALKANAEKANKIANVQNAITKIKEQQEKEVKDIEQKMKEIDAKVVELLLEKRKLSADIVDINSEANFEVTELNKTLAELSTPVKSDKCCCNKNKTNDCSVKVATFSDKDPNWKTVIDKTGTYEEVVDTLKKLKDSGNLQELLKLFNI